MRALPTTLFSLTLVACGTKPTVDTNGESGDTSEGSSSTSTSGTSTSTTAPSTESSSDPSTSSAPTTTNSFIQTPDGGAAMCDPKAQDCPEGKKCTAISDAPPDPWNANTCIEIMGSGDVGEPCDIQDGKYSGNDNCKEGTICLLTDDDGNDGVCVEFCDATDKCPQTPNAMCATYNDGALPICLGSCDPLIQDCPEGQACYNSAGDNFVCFKESAMPGEGIPGSPCQYINQCQKGNFCANSMAVVGCDPNSTGCCTPYCAISGGNAPCQMGEDCVAFFEMGMAPPAYEDVGVCAIPG